MCLGGALDVSWGVLKHVRHAQEAPQSRLGLQNQPKRHKAMAPFWLSSPLAFLAMYSFLAFIAFGVFLRSRSAAAEIGFRLRLLEPDGGFAATTRGAV